MRRGSLMCDVEWMERGRKGVGPVIFRDVSKKAIFRFKKREIPFRFRFIIGNVEFDEITIVRKKVR